MAREEGRYAQKASAGKELAQETLPVLPQGEAGLSGAGPDVPTSDEPSSWKMKGLPARPKK